MCSKDPTLGSLIHLIKELKPCVRNKGKSAFNFLCENRIHRRICSICMCDQVSPIKEGIIEIIPFRGEKVKPSLPGYR